VATNGDSCYLHCRERERDGEGERECVCVCVNVCVPFFVDTAPFVTCSS